MTTISNDGVQSYVAITPVNAKIGDARESNQLYITNMNVNPYFTAQIFWELRSNSQNATFDAQGNELTPALPQCTNGGDSFTIMGSTEAPWGNANVFDLVLDHLGLTAA